MDIIFLIPAVTTFQQMSGGISAGDGLFDLVAVLFLGAWLLGWSMAPLAMTTILLVMLFGREVLRVAPGAFELSIGLPFVALSATYNMQTMRNLRVETPKAKSGKSWRGQHFAFDYGANTVAFGSEVDLLALGELESSIKTSSGYSIRKGDALAEELEPKWEVAPKPPAAAVTSEATVAEPPAGWLTPSTLALLLANLVPVAGTLFLGWRLSDVMVLYWAESAIIGFFNVCKIVVIGRWAAVLAGPFFIGHFGGFMVVHFLFIYTLFVEGLSGGDGPSGSLPEVAALFISLWPALLALLVSHALSFYINFLGKKEYQGRTVSQQMSEPYSRIIFMHLVLIFGGGLSMFLGEPTPVILGVIALKIFFDIRAHLKQHSATDGQAKPDKLR